MSIFSRFGDIINSNINAILDKAEDPEKMVRLIIQEMEEALVEVRSTCARAIADKKELGRRQELLAAEAAEWDRKAEVAVSRGRDDLAKGALAERNKAEDASVMIGRELQIINESLAKLNEDVSALQAKIKDAKARQHAIIMRGKTAQTRLGVRRQLSDHSIDDAMERFETYERKIDNLEGEVEAYDMGQQTLSEEIADLETDERIDEELEKLKARMGNAVRVDAQNPSAPSAQPAESTPSDQSANA